MFTIRHLNGHGDESLFQAAFVVKGSDVKNTKQLIRYDAACLAIALIAVAATLAPAQSAPDAKGWRGAEWGMTKDEVVAAVSLNPVVTKPVDTKDPETTALLMGGVTIGDRMAVVTFYFDRAEKLKAVGLNFGDILEFNRWRDELTAKYGAPVSTGGGLYSFVSRAKWLLPSSEIVCEYWAPASTSSKGALIISYSRRSVPIL